MALQAVSQVAKPVGAGIVGRQAADYRPQAGREFAAHLELGRPLASDDPRSAQTAAAQLLATLFFQPLLAEMREFPFGEQFGGGGMMEEAFAEQLDERIADQVAQQSPALLNVVQRYFEPRQERAEQAAATQARPAAWSDPRLATSAYERNGAVGVGTGGSR